MPLLPKSNSYSILLKRVKAVLIEGQARIETERVRTYWRTGRIIQADIIKNKERAEYGAEVVDRLSKDLGISGRQLHYCVQFFKAYPQGPIVHGRAQLKWTHFRELIAVTDKKKRVSLERAAARKGWSAEELAKQINKEKPVEEKKDAPIAQLAFTRGRLNVYGVVASNKQLAEESPLALDFGFRVQIKIPSKIRCKEGEALEKAGAEWRKVKVKADELFTYAAKVEKVIDGDTLVVSFPLSEDITVSQKLRLRGIDCSEMDTEEGKAAKRFVESRLKACEGIVVKTYKDRTDKFDRYLADIFILEGAFDPLLVARDGSCLNQELLNERLAVAY